MREHLQGWIKRSLELAPDGGRDGGQFVFVRNSIGDLVWGDVPWDGRPFEPPPRDDSRVSAVVIGEHTSKGVLLPVYSFDRPDLGVRLVMRGNFHDWNVSVQSEMPITADLRGFCLDYSEQDKQRRAMRGPRVPETWGDCCFQGFPPELCFGPYTQDPRRFSIALGSDYLLYTFIWLVLGDVRGRGTMDA